MAVKSVPTLSLVLWSTLSRWCAHIPLKTNVANSNRRVENRMVFSVFFALIEDIGLQGCYCTSTFHWHWNPSSNMKSVSKQSTDKIFLAEFMGFSQIANLLFYFYFQEWKTWPFFSYFILASWIGKYILSFSRYFIIIITIFPQQKKNMKREKEQKINIK